MNYLNTAKRSLVKLYLSFKASKEKSHLETIRLWERLRTFEDEQDTFARSMLAWEFDKIGDKTRALYYGNQVLNVDPYNVLMLKFLIRIYFDQKEHAIVYGYVQRATSYLPDPQIEKTKAALTRWLGILVPWFRMVPKLRVILPKMERALKDDYNYESEWLHWAQGYKQWYEERLSLGDSPLPPGESWN